MCLLGLIGIVIGILSIGVVSVVLYNYYTLKRKYSELELSCVQDQSLDLEKVEETVTENTIEPSKDSDKLSGTLISATMVTDIITTAVYIGNIPMFRNVFKDVYKNKKESLYKKYTDLYNLILNYSPHTCLLSFVDRDIEKYKAFAKGSSESVGKAGFYSLLSTSSYHVLKEDDSNIYYFVKYFAYDLVSSIAVEELAILKTKEEKEEFIKNAFISIGYDKRDPKELLQEKNVDVTEFYDIANAASKKLTEL